MASDLQARVKREAEFYDTSPNHRGKLGAALVYLDEGIGRQRRREVIRAAMLGATGKRVLEIGSQEWESCVYAHGYQPARITCINISEAELEIGRAAAARRQFPCDFCKMDAHNLEFADGSLDIVFGLAILHHLEFPRALREVHRVLRKGGKLLFVEPLRHNPVARLIRWMTPHARTADEMPLGRPELRLAALNFDMQNYYSEMLTVLGAAFARPFYKSPINPITKFCVTADDLVARLAPAAGVYYRSVILHGTKRSETWRE